jgi:hypothetical protein
MTLCPVAIAVGCKKCPIYSVCPVKGLIGDAPSADAKKHAGKAEPASKKKK